MRDIYENNANNGARRVREAIFAILPPWFVEEAKELCNKTLKGGGGRPLAQRIADAIRAFGSIGISEDQLQDKLGRPSTKWTEHDTAQLHVSSSRSSVARCGRTKSSLRRGSPPTNSPPRRCRVSWHLGPLAALDLETTGLDPLSAAVIVVRGQRGTVVEDDPSRWLTMDRSGWTVSTWRSRRRRPRSTGSRRSRPRLRAGRASGWRGGRCDAGADRRAVHPDRDHERAVRPDGAGPGVLASRLAVAAAAGGPGAAGVGPAVMDRHVDRVRQRAPEPGGPGGALPGAAHRPAPGRRGRARRGARRRRHRPPPPRDRRHAARRAAPAAGHLGPAAGLGTCPPVRGRGPCRARQRPVPIIPRPRNGGPR